MESEDRLSAADDVQVDRRASARATAGPVTVSPLTDNDIAQAADVLVGSFWEYPEVLHLLPDERTREFGLRRFMRFACGDALRFDEALVAKEADRVVGVALWRPPAASPMSPMRQVREALALLPVGLRLPGVIREAGRGSRAIRRRHPPESYHHLSELGVDPQYQRRGVGARLLAPLLTKADAESVGCHLYTNTSANVAWYSRFGFAVLDEFRRPLGGPRSGRSGGIRLHGDRGVATRPPMSPGG